MIIIFYDFPRMIFYEKIKELSKRRIASYIEGNNSFYQGSGTYFSKLVEEVAEAAVENKEDNRVYLEDELGDIFRDYMCLLQSLKSEWKIRWVEEVLERSYKKFVERVWVDGKGKWIIWDEIKKGQKIRLEKEHRVMYRQSI